MTNNLSSSNANDMRSEYFTEKNIHGKSGMAPLSSVARPEVPPGLFILALLYLLLPTIIVLIGFQPWKFAIPAAIAAAATCYWLVAYWRKAGGRWPAWQSWPFLILAALAVWMSGVIPPFAENGDWTKHYALFNALTQQTWPPAVPTEAGMGTLRYSLSYYVIPALAGKYAGAALLAPAIFIWTTLGLYLSLLLAFGATGLSVSARFALAAIFLLFSGADIVGAGITGVPQAPVMHYEWWAHFGEFPSNITSVIWTPQHALSAWIATFLILRYPARAVQAGGVLGAAVAIWSPFSVVGIVPVMAWAVYRAGPRHLFSWMNIAAAPVLLLAGAAFLTRGSAGIPAGLLWDRPDFTLTGWLLFVALEFALIALALLLVSRRHALLIAVSCAALVLLALTNVGVANDLMMRGSLPALAILASLSATAIVSAPNTWRKTPLIVFLIVGLVTPMGEIMRGLTGQRFVHPEQYRVTDVTWGDGARLAAQYIVPGYAGPVARTRVAFLEGKKLQVYGAAEMDPVRRRIASGSFTDAAFVVPAIILPPGLYEIDAIADWDLIAAPGAKHAAHISLHGIKPIVTIGSSRAVGQKLHGYFLSKGEPLVISFGMGGWAKARGFIEFKQIKINRVTYQ